MRSCDDARDVDDAAPTRPVSRAWRCVPDERVVADRTSFGYVNCGDRGLRASGFSPPPDGGDDRLDTAIEAAIVLHIGFLGRAVRQTDRMSRALLLRCPVCDATHAFRGDRDTHEKAELLNAAADHLRGHSLGESTRAIRKHEVVSDAEERILSDDELARLPTDGWAENAAIIG